MHFFATKSKLVPIVVILVAMLFFFHGSNGGFQTKYGPTSTLKECAIGLLLQSLMLLLARAVLKLATFMPDGSLPIPGSPTDSFRAPRSSLTPLRC